jgi:MFS family permease
MMKIKRNIYLLYAISLLHGMVFYGPIATLYRQAAGVSVFQITLIESISLALCIALEMPWGAVADRIGYKNTMIINCAIYFVSKIVFWKADGFSDFLLERLMLSVVMAGMSGCDVSILYLSSSEGESHKVFGIYQSLMTAGLLAAAFVYSAFLKNDYRMAGFLTVLSYGAAALLTLGLKEVRGAEEKDERKGRFQIELLAVLKDWRFLLVLIEMALLWETRQTITVFLSQLQYVRSGIPPSVMGYIYIVVTLTGLSGIWSAKVMRKTGMVRFGVWTFGAAAFACFLLAWTRNPVVSVLGIMLLQLAAALFYPLQLEIQNRHVKSADRATILSIYAVVTEGTGIFTNLLFGRAAEAGVFVAMLLGGVLCLLAGTGFLAWCNQKKYDMIK